MKAWLFPPVLAPILIVVLIVAYGAVAHAFRDAAAREFWPYPT